MYMIDSSSLFGESRRGVSPFTPEVCASIKSLLKENNVFSKNVDYEVIRKKNYLFSPMFYLHEEKINLPGAEEEVYQCGFSDFLSVRIKRGRDVEGLVAGTACGNSHWRRMPEPVTAQRHFDVCFMWGSFCGALQVPHEKRPCSVDTHLSSQTSLMFCKQIFTFQPHRFSVPHTSVFSNGGTRAGKPRLFFLITLQCLHGWKN